MLMLMTTMMMMLSSSHPSTTHSHSLTGHRQPPSTAYY